MSTGLKWRLGGALILALSLVACGSDSGGETSEAKAATRVVKADNGGIAIPVVPKRVVATGYAVPALIQAKAPLVGISTWPRGEATMNAEIKATYDKLAKVAGDTAADTNYEAIAETKPDLTVIGVPKPVLGEIDLKRLQSIAPVVAIGPSIPSAWRELSQRQADAAGAMKGFDAVKAAYEAKAAELTAKYKDVLPALKLAHVGAYGQVDKGTFQREFDGSWGTNVASRVETRTYAQTVISHFLGGVQERTPLLDGRRPLRGRPWSGDDVCLARFDQRWGLVQPGQ
ncbi:hypothetical protein GCM10022419_134630 [Nonomuraea rosea]|uniref:Fe/B12 periplasmic-binding domain-containing protein n=1 Tax=Nonomuraea rosea TaxID=638574 RepID=A0ABP7A741_9ACTN